MKKPSILIVDDDVRITVLLIKFFQNYDFFVKSAHNVEEAKREISVYNYDLLILDVMLPGITGSDFAFDIRSKEKHLPIIMLTALDDPAIKERNIQNGVNAYLTKPFNTKDLLLNTKLLMQEYFYFKYNQKIFILNNCLYNQDLGLYIKTDNITQLEILEKSLLDYFLYHQGELLNIDAILGDLDLSREGFFTLLERIQNNIDKSSLSFKHIIISQP